MDPEAIIETCNLFALSALHDDKWLYIEGGTYWDVTLTHCTSALDFIDMVFDAARNSAMQREHPDGALPWDMKLILPVYTWATDEIQRQVKDSYVLFTETLLTLPLWRWAAFAALSTTVTGLGIVRFLTRRTLAGYNRTASDVALSLGGMSSWAFIVGMEEPAQTFIYGLSMLAVYKLLNRTNIPPLFQMAAMIALWWGIDKAGWHIFELMLPIPDAH